MFFDFLRKKPDKTEEILKEIQAMKVDIHRLDSDFGTLFNGINTQIWPTVVDLKKKVDDVFDVTKLAILNNENIKILEVRIKDLDGNLKTHIFQDQENTHNFKKVEIVSESLKTSKDNERHLMTPNNTLFNKVSSEDVTDIPSFTGSFTPFTERSLNELNDHRMTDAEKRVFVILASLIGESPEKEARYEDLIRELYPNMPHAKIKSTVSNFLRKLERAGLIKREHRGKRAVIFLTQKGIELIGEQSFKKLKKTLSK